MKLLLNLIRKSYDGKPVLRECSHAFGGNGIYVLMGRNGCGKSTLLRICALLEPADGGELVFSDDGVPLAQDLALRRRMTLILPRIGVFNASVFDNISYGLRLRGAGRQEIERKVSEALAFVGMEHLRLQNALTLSSGETQRMGLARSLAIEPEILFLDEPTASVDEENTAIIESLIRKLTSTGRTMVIMTTHDRDQADRIADFVLFLQNGRICLPPNEYKSGAPRF